MRTLFKISQQRGKTFSGLILGVGLLVSLPSMATAQTTDQAQAQMTEKIVQETVFSAASVALTELIEREPTPIRLSFKKIKDLPPGVSADGVSIIGYSQYVDVEGQLVGQVIVTELEKGGRTATLDPKAFNAQFDLEQALLATDKEIEIGGDRAALIEALRLLSPEEKEEEEEAQTEGSEQAETANNGVTNDQASGYETPERIEAEAEPQISVETTTNGCTVRVDYTQQVAVQQSKTVYYEDGAISSEDACSDSEVRYPLQKSYEVCNDDVDMTALTATAKYTWFYVDQGQSRNDVSDCEADTEKVFEIVEKQSCSVSLDFDKEQAIIQTTLVYNNINGLETKVRDCEASISIEPLPMTMNTETCAMKHEFSKGYSEQMGTWIYEYDGVIYQATLCTNTDVKYTHEKVYKTSGSADLCSVFVDLDGSKATPQYRIQITPNGQPEYISECTPDEGGALSIHATTDGCTDPLAWEHDLAGGISYGTQRYYYENPTRVYVTECLRSTATYDHSLTTTGYQNHDDIKAAYPLTTVKINVNGTDYEVASSQVLPGASLLPYVYSENREEVIGNTYSGCDVIRTTANSEIYDRPDATEYAEVVGPGSPIGPIDACGTVVQTPAWKKISDVEPVYVSKNTKYDTTCWMDVGDSNMPWMPCRITAKQWQRQATYKGTRVLSREDGANVTQTSSTNRVYACEILWQHEYLTPASDISKTPSHEILYNGGQGSYVTYSCPTNYVDSYVYTWNQAEGW